MSKAEAARRAAILEALGRKRREVEETPLPANLGALLDRAVERYRDRVCWLSIEDGESLTFGAFGEQVARCAAALRRLGVARGTQVGVMLPSVPAVAITWMALARLGAVMIPINTRYTQRELDHVLTGGRAELLVIDAAHRDLLEREGEAFPLPLGRVVVHGAAVSGTAGEWHQLVSASEPLAENPQVDLDEVMTLQFTSGSTGAPKACVLPHRYWLVLALTRLHQGPPIGRLLHDMPFHYMGGQWRFLMALWGGITACVAPRPSLTRMLDRLLAHRIEFCSVTPALAKQPLAPRRGDLSLAWAGTMAMPKHLCADVEERLGGAPVREMYGTTETGAAVAMPYEVDWMEGSCGLAVPFRDLKLVDAEGNEVRDGTPGELWIAGPGVMQGYFANEEATRAAFCGAWFRSGDLFVRDRDGFMTMLGRIKDVIRRSGENISASEVESVLMSLPQVEEAAAVGVPDDLRGEEVMACLKLAPGVAPADLPAETVVDWCRKQLAPFKVPRYVAYLPELPKTPSGKIAKKAVLPALAANGIETWDAAAPSLSALT